MHRAGAQVHLGHLVRGLVRRGHRPEIRCLLAGGALADQLAGEGVPVTIDGLGRLYRPGALVRLSSLARELRAHRPAIVHTYLPSANVFGALAARLAGVGAIVTSRRDMGFSRNWRLRLLEEAFVNPAVAAVTAVCPAVAEVVRRERGLDPRKLVTIPNGVDVNWLDPERHSRVEARRELGVPLDAFAVGILASLSPVKGHAELLRAGAIVAAATPSARFFVVGDGELRSDLETLATSLGLGSRVIFTGVRSDVPRVLAALDVSVLASYTEGLSNTLLESMAMARPVIATAVGGNRDVVRNGENGLLVPPADPVPLAEAILRLFRSPGEASALGAAARRHVERYYSLEEMVSQYEQLYDSMCGQ